MPKAAKQKLRQQKQRSLTPPRSVLFIGNSFTARNDLPGMIATLAAAAGMDFEHQLINVGGASLRTHWNKGDALKLIKSGGFDCVVLQEQSTLPVKNASRMHENVRLFDGAIKASASKTALYLTWARQAQPQNQALITGAYESIGNELGATVVPAGIVWQGFARDHKQPTLYGRDGSHPSLAGTFLCACVFFKTLFGRSPKGLIKHVDGLSDEETQLIAKYVA